MSTTLEAPAPSTFRTFVAPRLADVEPDVFVRRDQIPQSLLATEADTLGWDTVNAIRLPQVNAAMLKSDLYPKKFDTGEISPGWSLTGDFGPWTLVRGGSGAIVFLRTPLPLATMTFTGTPDLVVHDGWASIAIKLEYLPQPPSARQKALDEGGNEEYLASSFKARSADDPAVVIQNVGYGDAHPDPLADALFRGALGKWFNSNLDKFTYVFSVVNLNARAAKDQFQWLKPTYTSYAYFNGATDVGSYFGVLNMTSGKQPEGLTNQLPPGAIPQDCNGSILISSDLFMRQMIMPGLTKTFTRATESSFKISANGKVIESVTDITLDDIKIDGTNYTPTLQSFTLQSLGDELQIDTKTKVHVSEGIDVYITATEYYKIVLVNKPDGGQTLDFQKSRDAKRNHWSEIATWIIVTEIIIGIIAAVASTVAGKLIESLARRILAILIIALVAGLAAAIPKIIAMVLDGKAAEALPAIGDMVMEASSDVKWPDSTGFTLALVELNGSLVMGGNLVTTT
jgi:hypothetical protein